MGAHFYCSTFFGQKQFDKASPLSVKREGGGREGSWKSLFANIVHSLAHHPPSQPTIAAQLLGEPAAGEPYTILIMVQFVIKTGGKFNFRRFFPTTGPLEIGYNKTEKSFSNLAASQ
jgi:hypothetical protein